MILHVSLNEDSYPIFIEEHCADSLGAHMNTKRKTMIVHDDHIPQKWVDLVSSQFENCSVFSFEQGEGSKHIETVSKLWKALAENRFSRKDQVVALGGGVTGDLAGFGAACYMRGIDFYNIPTTVLSQVDSSVGGKTGVDLDGLKNLIGAFWQPKAVFIDPQFLSTLDARQIANGLAEALKMAVLFDPDMLDEFEKENPDVLKLIAMAIDAKRRVVEEDEKESGLRRSLNFGHTIGHAIESSAEDFKWLHGECVAAGMLYMIRDEALGKRVAAIEKKLGLPKIDDFDKAAVMEALSHDKKSIDNGVACVFADAPGKFSIENKTLAEIEELLEEKPYEKYVW